MTLRELMEGLAREANVEGGFVADEKGVVRVAVDDFAVTLAEIEGGRQLLMWSPVADCPEGDVGRLCEVLLRANFLGAATAGATLSLSDDGNLFCLHRRCPLEGLTFDGFMEAFEIFAEMTLSWRALIEEFDARPSGGTGLSALGFVR